MDTEPSSPLNIPTPFTIIETLSCCLPQHWLCHYLIPCLTLAGDSPVVPPTKQTQTQVLSFCIFTHSQKYDNNANLKVRQCESPRSAKIWPLPPTITNHHQTCAPSSARFCNTPLVLSGVDRKQQKANLYSFAHLVCCCLLSMVWDRLLASRRQTLVHAGLLACCTKKYQG